ESAESLFSSETIERFERHHWPGNVRELRNAVLGTLALGKTDPLTMLSSERIEGYPSQFSESSVPSGPYSEARKRVLQRFELQYLTSLLERAHGNVRQAARDARMDRSYLMELLRRHGLR